MLGIPPRSGRRLAAAAAAAAWLAAAPAFAEGEGQVEVASAAAPARSAPSAVAVFVPRSPDALRSVDEGVRIWIVQELRASGVPVVSLEHVDAVAARQLGPERPFLRGADAPVLAREGEAGAVLLSQLTLAGGRVEVWLRAYAASGEVLGVGHGTSPLATLGDALVTAFGPVRRALGGGASETTLAPRLANLAHYERAAERLAAGDLAGAWRALEGLQTPTAEAFRDDIVARGAAPDADVAERSRLASARGEADPDWLALRRRLQSERRAPVLLAGAEHAVAGGDSESALALFDEAARVAPSSADAARGRARTLAALERHAEAKLAFERVAELAPGDTEAQLALAQNPTLAPDAQAERWLEAGRLQSETLDDDGARSSFERAAAIDADLSAAARRYTARLEEALGNDAAAFEAYRAASAADAADLDALAGLARMHGRRGEAAEASQAFAKVLAAKPDDAAALAGYGDALLAQGQAAEAVPQLKRALALAPRSAARRAALARAYQAAGDEASALSVLDPEQVDAADRPRLLEQAASLHGEAVRLVEAQTALEQAIAIEPDEPPLRSALARLHAQAGHVAEAEQQQALVTALSGAREVATQEERLSRAGAASTSEPQGDEFAALVASFPTETAERRPIRHVAWLGLERTQTWPERVRRWLLPQVIDQAALEAALRAAFAERFVVEPLRPVPGPARASLENLRAFGTDRADVALANDVLGVDAVVVGRFGPAEPEGWLDPPSRTLALELRLATGRQTSSIHILANAAKLSDASPYFGWNRRAAALLAVASLLLLLPFVRGWGSIVVVLDYERTRGSQGFFSIELSRRPGRTKQEKKGTSGRSRAAKYQRKAKPWARYTRHMVGRETRMGWLPARAWYVAVHGLLQDTTSQEVIGNYLEERKIRVTRGQTLEVVFDFRRKAAPIEVRLFREEGLPPLAGRVAVLGVPDSLRFVKEDAITVFLGRGKHTLLVAVEDRLYERPVEVTELVGQVVNVAVDALEDARFTGCAEAIEPYLQGDLLRASQVLEGAGLREPALLARAEHHRRRGESEAAARCLEQLGRYAEAAELAKQSPAAKRSADLFEKAGDFHQAAEAHAQAGSPLEAARAYEAAFEYAAAIESYKAAGVTAKVLELLEKTGRFYEAAAIALEQRDADRAIRCFQQVGPREGDYAEACEALAQLFAERDAFDLAVEKAREAIEVRGADDAPLDALEAFAKLLERAGHDADALGVWENIRKRDFAYRGASERVEALRQSVAATERASDAATGAASEARAETSVAAAPSAAGSTRYEVLGEVGRGGMGVVVKARDTRLGRTVALKRMPENLKSNPTAVQLFLREARAAAALSHPNIVTLFDADQEADGSYYLTMELLEGFGLDAVLKKRGKLSARDAVRLGVQIAKGLQFAHEKGVVHRDIKTANLFFTKDRVVKIMDFGLAKMSEEVRRSATVIGGTPYYMAPEQAAGEKVDHRADLYALGVTLFELVTGTVPFREGDVTHHHRHTPAPDPRTLVPDLPEPLARLILQLMAKAPAERPASAAEVARALEQLLAQLGAALSGPGRAG